MAAGSHPECDPIAVTADVALLTGPVNGRNVLLVVRGAEPYRGHLAFPGGFVEPSEDLPVAAVRELREETGVTIEPGQLTQLGAYGAPGRDPRMRVVSVVFYALVDDIDSPTAGDDASDALVVPAARALSDGLAFDHDVILTDVVEALG